LQRLGQLEQRPGRLWKRSGRLWKLLPRAFSLSYRVENLFLHFPTGRRLLETEARREFVADEATVETFEAEVDGPKSMHCCFSIRCCRTFERVVRAGYTTSGQFDFFARFL
jgi:hypothetical protein